MYNGRGIAAGLAIGLTTLLYLELEGGIVGALCIGLGFLIVVALKLDLFTAKVRPIMDKEITVGETLLSLGGNLVGLYFMYGLGTTIMGYHHIKDFATIIISERAQLPLGYLFMRAILSGICV